MKWNTLKIVMRRSLIALLGQKTNIEALMEDAIMYLILGGDPPEASSIEWHQKVSFISFYNTDTTIFTNLIFTNFECSSK